MLYNLIISPIEVIVDWVFTFFTIKFESFGIVGAICGVSLIINLLALPLYNIADSLQEKERKAAKALEPRVKRIKKAFKGNEQFLILSTYYRQNNYHPLYVLRSSLSILIEIPFFIAAYHYLSNCEALKGASLWIFRDFGNPDGLLHLGNFKIHILPILMTLINFISGTIYTKEAPFREKVQLYLVAILFLFLLYNSPSGLVFYWILNNLFSLAKNIVMKTKQPGKILYICISAVLLLISGYFFTTNGAAYKKLIVFLFAIIFISIPFIKRISANKIKLSGNKIEQSTLLFTIISCGLSLSILCGLLLPSSIIDSSPSEFSLLGETESPLTYIWKTLFTSLGFFVFWPICIYKMFGQKTKRIESFLFVALFFSALANSYVFKFNYGEINTSLRLENPDILQEISKFNLLGPVILLIVIISLCVVLIKTEKFKYISYFVFAISLAQIGVSVTKISHIKDIYTKYAQAYKSSNKIPGEIEPVYHLSKDGTNVIVLFLDRAVNSYLPYAMEELPELREQLRGFTYYPNTLSYSCNTTIASPAMMGGYEYSPERLNERSTELLKDKHNEASLVMPALFSQAGYEITITDPPCPNYSLKGDLSNFENKDNLKAYELIRKYTEKFQNEVIQIKTTPRDKVVNKEMLNFSVLEMLPPFLRNTFYGDFRERPENHNNEEYYYLENISALYYLKELTDFNTSKNQFIFIDNETPHRPTYLKSDLLTPCLENEGFAKHYDNNDTKVITHYYSFLSAVKQIGIWFDYLRENNVYDNTRIIIVADHGRTLNLNDFNNFDNPGIPASYTPLLMVKDFNSNSEIQVNKDFMTNADTLFFAKENLGLSDTNPFTGKTFVTEKDDGINVFYIYGNEWNCEKIVDKTEFTLDASTGYHVSSDIFKKENWVPYTDWISNK